MVGCSVRVRVQHVAYLQCMVASSVWQNAWWDAVRVRVRVMVRVRVRVRVTHASVAAIGPHRNEPYLQCLGGIYSVNR